MTGSGIDRRTDVNWDCEEEFSNLAKRASKISIIRHKNHDDVVLFTQLNC